MPPTKVGFIGLGRMGLPMSYRLLAAGFDLTVHDRSQGKVQEIALAGAWPATSVAEVVREAEVVLACLLDVATSEEIFLGDDGIIANSKPGQVLVDHSTVGMATSKACAAAAEAKGAFFLDAPISGGTERAATVLWSSWPEVQRRPISGLCHPLTPWAQPLGTSVPRAPARW